MCRIGKAIMSSIRLPSNVIKLPTTFAGNRGVRVNTSARPTTKLPERNMQIIAKTVDSKQAEYGLGYMGIPAPTITFAKEILDKIMAHSPEVDNVHICASASRRLDLSALKDKVPPDIDWTPVLVPFVDVPIDGPVTIFELKSFLSGNWGSPFSISAKGKFFHGDIKWNSMHFNSAEKIIYLQSN